MGLDLEGEGRRGDNLVISVDSIGLL
jgi:hypothetical protein